MSLQLPRRRAESGARRVLLPAALAASTLALAGCSVDEGAIKRIAMPDPVTTQGEHTLALWQGAWIAALATGVLVWGLIFYVIWRYRRRHDDEIPIQTRYNLPLEIFYTIAPIMMVVVFFAHTVRTQNAVLEESPTPDNIIEVSGQQWQWTFNHGLGEPDYAAEDDSTDDKWAYEEYVWDIGTGSYIPTLVLPVGETTRFNLHSPDVIHSFGIPGFLMKMDVIPGRVNHFEVTPKTLGTYVGKCYELCGVYHSRMLFNVEIVTPEQYDAYLAEQADEDTSTTPLLGQEDVRTQSGLLSEDESEGDTQ